jgi:hypothetical protein
VEVAFAGRAVAEVRDGEVFRLAIALAHRGADGFGDLIADGGRGRHDVQVAPAAAVRHHAPLRRIQRAAQHVPEPLGCLETFDELAALRAVIAIHPVRFCQRQRAAHLRGFLTGDLGVEARAALAHQDVTAIIDRTDEDHPSVHDEQLLGGEVERRDVARRLAVVLHVLDGFVGERFDVHSKCRGLRNRYYVEFRLLWISDIPSAIRKFGRRRSGPRTRHIPLLNYSFRLAGDRQSK